MKENNNEKDNNPLISIVVPVYNVEKYLSKCVQSIITQSYNNIEIILVDDGSTDSCPALCDDFAVKDNRIVVIHKQNGGLVTARKAGFAVATGDYIMSVDSDDWIESDMCEGLLTTILQSGAEVAVSGYIHETKNGNTKEVALKDNVYFFEKHIDEDDYVSRSWVIDNWLSGGQDIISPIVAKLYPAHLIRQSYSNVPDTMNQGEDLANFVNLIACIKSIVCTSNTYYHYIFRGDSYSNFINAHEFSNLFSMIAYCRDTILKRYENINKDILDSWVIKQCVGDLKRINSGGKFDFQTYFFQNPKILDGKKIIIYGAGAVGKDYYCQLCRYETINIVGWIDKNYSQYSYNWKRIEPIKSILNKTYDYVVIAVKNESVAKEIGRELVDIGVKQEKILWCEPSVWYDF